MLIINRSILILIIPNKNEDFLSTCVYLCGTKELLRKMDRYILTKGNKC